MEFQSLIFIAIGSIFISNFVLHKFLGLCPYIGVSKQLDSALGMGMAVIFVMTIASLVTWTIYNYFLAPTQNNLIFQWFLHSKGNPPDLTYLRTIAFILVIAALVQFVEMVVHKLSRWYLFGFFWKTFLQNQRCSLKIQPAMLIYTIISDNSIFQIW